MRQCKCGRQRQGGKGLLGLKNAQFIADFSASLYLGNNLVASARKLRIPNQTMSSSEKLWLQWNNFHFCERVLYCFVQNYYLKVVPEMKYFPLEQYLVYVCEG